MLIWNMLPITPPRAPTTREIASHIMRVFKYLKELKQGDKIIITDSNNEVYIYEVLELEVLEATDVEKMINNDFDLTLYTCTDGGLRRLAVRSNRIN